jgi:transposase InsO family protein
MAPAAIYTTLLDEGQYLASIRTMYRLLARAGQSLERRRQRIHPEYAKPELLATRPNAVWSWDITKLKGPVRWSVYHLYVILDIFSRYVVGWVVAMREAAELAEQLIAGTIAKQDIAPPSTLTLHADRGTNLRSKPVAALRIDLDVARTHSRPHVSDDNPYSESQFRTLKYGPEFPGRFGSLEDARTRCQGFFHWYNHEHHHSGIGLMPPGTPCTTASQKRCTCSAPELCSLPITRSHCASKAAYPSRWRCRRPPGSTRPSKETTITEILSTRSLNSFNHMSQSDRRAPARKITHAADSKPPATADEKTIRVRFGEARHFDATARSSTVNANSSLPFARSIFCISDSRTLPRDCCNATISVFAISACR